MPAKPESSRNNAGGSLLAQTLGCALAAAFVLYAAGGAKQKTDFNDAALGGHTTSIFPTVGEYPIHISEAAELDKLVAGWKARGEKPAVLWLGNSQLHAVNQANPGAQPASAKLFPKLAKSNGDLLTFSLPNANLQEHYLVFETCLARVDVKCLVLPVVFDDFRETGIRSDLADVLQSSASSLMKTDVGQLILANQADAAKPEGTSEDATLQDMTERSINHWLDDHVAIWELRPELRGKFFLQLYILRNKAFGISAQSKRRQIPGRYRLNWDALETLLDSAGQHDVPVLLYVVPLRSDVDTPYDKSEYEQFKSELATLAKEKRITFSSLEDLVPSELWGHMGDIAGGGQGLDFMHFQEGGHVLLAEEIKKGIGAALAP